MKDLLSKRWSEEGLDLTGLSDAEAIALEDYAEDHGLAAADRQTCHTCGTREETDPHAHDWRSGRRISLEQWRALNV